jgi:hypothetical protein
MQVPVTVEDWSSSRRSHVRSPAAESDEAPVYVVALCRAGKPVLKRHSEGRTGLRVGDEQARDAAFATITMMISVDGGRSF